MSLNGDSLGTGRSRKRATPEFSSLRAPRKTGSAWPGLPHRTTSLARVTVNRYWQMIFGRDWFPPPRFPNAGQATDPSPALGLVGPRLRELGGTCAVCSSPWSSHTYRQESRILPEAKEEDPENFLLSRAPAYRLPAEMIRDGLLAQSGLLHTKVGGAGARPYDLKVSFKPINPDGAPNVYRRSLYTFWKRTGPAPVMMALDASKRDVCTVRRERTDSASQALILLNGTQFVEAARATADKLIEKHGEEDLDKLATEAFRQLTSRHPDKRETAILLRLLRDQREFFQDEKETKKFLEVGYYRAKTKNHALLAAVTNFVSTLMNFDETLSKR